MIPPADCLTLSLVGIREPAQGAEDIPLVDGDGQDRTEKTVRHFLDLLDLLFQRQSRRGNGIVIPGRITDVRPQGRPAWHVEVQGEKIHGFADAFDDLLVPERKDEGVASGCDEFDIRISISHGF
jgi:hypothetical protein